jgi:hypothetical protein
MSEKIKIPTIPNDAICNIKLSGAFYKYIQDSYFEILNLVEPDDLQNVLTAILKNNNENVKEENKKFIFIIKILSILIKEIEESFKNDIVMTEIDKPKSSED